MMRRIGAAFVLGALAWLIPLPAGATEIGLGELLADPSALNGETITVVGELVGDYGFRRDGFVWSQLNGDAYASAPLREGGALQGSNVGIGVRAPADLIEDLDPPGDYQHRGPLVRATGTWRYHDPERGGETYLEVATIEVVERGFELDEPAQPAVYGIATALLVAAGWLGYRRRTEE